MKQIELKNIAEFQDTLSDKSGLEVLKWTESTFEKKAVFATSLGAEDQVITDLIVRHNLDIEIFTLDTGRMFNESYDLIEATEKKYGIKIKIYSPDSKELEDLVLNNGINSFRYSIEKRKGCCGVRKLGPLGRALSEVPAWICGLRKEQSVTRTDMEAIEWDGMHRMPKLNPLINWSEKDVWDYIKENDVPYNELHDKGFLSIGCAPCTRAVEKGEDVRAGRWWWETSEQKECGLHKQ